MPIFITFIRYCKILTLCLSFLSCVFLNSAKAGSFQDEYTVKAVLLLNFLEFVEWPASDRSKSKQVCVVNSDNPIIAPLHTVIETKGGMSSDFVSVVGRDSRLDQCNLLYIDSADKRDMSLLIGRSEGLPILTVSDHEKFADLGGAVSVYLESGQVRLKANLTALRKAGLTMDSELLEVMDIVR